MKPLKTKILYILSKKILKKYHPDVIGIVGSVGKTSTKQAIDAVLSKKFHIRKNDGVLRNDIEAPSLIINASVKNSWLSKVWQAIKLLVNKDDNYPDIIILELAVSRPGELEFINQYIHFRIGVITATELPSVSAFDNIKKLAAGQEVLIKGLQSDSVAILNADDELVSAMRSKAKVMKFGINQEANLKAGESAISLNGVTPGSMPIKGISFKINYQGSVVPVLIPNILGTHQIYSSLAGIICGLVYQMNLSEIANSFKKYQAPAGRMRILRGIKKTVLIDDSYDSSPVSCRAAILALSLIPTDVRTESYAVLGDMKNLGKNTETAHREIGHYVAEKGINKLITIGERARDMALAARDAGMHEDKVFSFADVKSAGSFIQDRLEARDVVLIKGSSVMRMEAVTRELMADPQRAGVLLVERN